VDLTLNEKDGFISPPPTQKKRSLNDDSADTMTKPVAVVTPTRYLAPPLKLDALRDLLESAEQTCVQYKSDKSGGFHL
jgi:hypothetical protein